MPSSQLFYSRLKRNEVPLHKLVGDLSLFRKVPSGWYVVVTDIMGSTKAVENGFHNDVNLTATGSIITVLNEVKRIDSNIKIPYFFGGDGATFIVPKEFVNEIEKVLQDYSVHAQKTMGLVLRTGSMPVSEIYDNGQNLQISKIRLNRYLTVPVVMGMGLKYAERRIKEEFVLVNYVDEENLSVNLTGMECRWDEISPNNNNGKVVCLIINSLDEANQSKLFSKILKEIHTRFGPLSVRVPITVNRLRLNTTIEKIKKEMFARVGKYSLGYLTKNWLITYFGKFYFRFSSDGKKYLYKVTQLSDTIMLDGSINTVMSGTHNQIAALKLYLEKLEANKKISFGLHETYASVMSCYVQDRKNNHIHFVDGTEGGYTSAAKKFKAKKLALKSKLDSN